MDEESRMDSASVADASEQAAALTAERDQLAQEKADLQDLLMRRQAEFENFRRRTERERMEFAEYAGMETIKNLLPSLDDFDRALKAAQTVSADPEFVKGFELIYSRMLEALKKLGLEPIETKGKKFDPHLHHAVQKVPMADMDDEMIVAEYQAGFNFKGRLLRPAMVQVAVRPQATASEDSAE
jgi:molecular chaperone GrpE